MRLVCQLFYRSMPLLSTRHVSSCRRLPLGPEKPLYTDDSIVPRAGGVRFFLVHSCSPGTIRKHWNRTTEYVKTRHVPEVVSGIYAWVCGLKIVSIDYVHVPLVYTVPGLGYGKGPS